ncbi:MAG: hypothetical protein IPM79_30875 [Polyangiaceae bacterium]|jgi:diadenosine tetraphosphate (Ap4A) HIT family hydrolase|nr:hypothetical protein [Polyangiaceae bacterium]MBK8941889.1 hypothetical protein [Polyangiaceae bacterium]
MDCGICRTVAGESGNRDEAIFDNGLWHVRHGGAPYGVPGWLMLITKRHVPGPWAFSDEEAQSLGPTIRHVGQILLEATGALRIYTAWMGESWPHFHAHLVPRYASMPKDAKAWGAFDLQRAAGAGEIQVDLAEVDRLTKLLRERLAASPPP